jgi:hypothetical protein
MSFSYVVVGKIFFRTVRQKFFRTDLLYFEKPVRFKVTVHHITFEMS